VPLNKLVSFLFRYKLHHIPFWVCYHYFWWALTSGSAIGAFEGILFSNYKIKFASYVILQAIGVYFNLYFLIPRYLEKGRYLAYGGFLLLTIVTTASLITSGYYLNSYVTGISLQDLFNRDPGDFWGLFKDTALGSTIASMTLAMSIKLTKNWIKSEQRRGEIEKEQLATELKFLRSQFNPHFLFNTINSIFVLIHKNQDMASTSLAKFSDLLRYQLYECNEPYIDLNKEVAYLKNFIELEKLRHENYQLSVNINFSNEAGSSLHIAPFLLIPFVENAFKHVSQNADESNWIEIDASLDGTTLHFSIRNSHQVLQVATDKQDSGLGLANVRRRLELLYPKDHKLEVFKDMKSFSVSLKLNLSTVPGTMVLKTA